MHKWTIYEKAFVLRVESPIVCANTYLSTESRALHSYQTYRLCRLQLISKTVYTKNPHCILVMWLLLNFFLPIMFNGQLLHPFFMLSRIAYHPYHPCPHSKGTFKANISGLPLLLTTACPEQYSSNAMLSIQSTEFISNPFSTSHPQLLYLLWM